MDSSIDLDRAGDDLFVSAQTLHKEDARSVPANLRFDVFEMHASYSNVFAVVRPQETGQVV